MSYTVSAFVEVTERHERRRWFRPNLVTYTQRTQVYTVPLRNVIVSNDGMTLDADDVRITIQEEGWLQKLELEDEYGWIVARWVGPPKFVKRLSVLTVEWKSTGVVTRKPVRVARWGEADD